jgi:hypothetical protein
MRKLTLLAVGGGLAALLLKIRKSGGVQEVQPSTSPQQAADEPAPETVAEVRDDQTQDTVESPVVGVDGEESVIPDTSADDPVVREQEEAARTDAGSIGGDADTVTADVPPEMRPVVEGAGDAPETFETTDEQGR